MEQAFTKPNDLPHLTFHGCGHAFPTMALQAGKNPKVVSEALGHSSFTITLDTYSHVLPNMQDQLAGGCGQHSEAVVEISTIVEIGYCVLLYTSLPVGNNGTAGPF